MHCTVLYSITPMPFNRQDAKPDQTYCQESMRTKPTLKKSTVFVKLSTQELPHDSIALLECFSPLCRIKYEPVNYIYFQPICL